MSSENNVETTSEASLELETHPVQAYFEACGLDVSDFPRLYFRLEIRDRLSSNSHLFIPIRIPEKPGLIYESFARVTRVMEFPATQRTGHRRIIEVEWRVDEQASLETDQHSALQFVSPEVECPSCRFFFSPEPSILDEVSVKITCPSCLNYWTVKVEAPKTPADSVQLINDAFYRDPSKVRRQLDQWDSSEKERISQSYRKHLPFEFKEWDDGSSIQWLYGDSPGFSQVNGEVQGNFEILFRTFVNHLALRYFNNPSGSRSFSRLDTTDILRKTDIQEKKASQQQVVSELLPTAGTESSTPEFTFQPTYDPYANGPARVRPKSSNLIPIALSLILIGGIISFFGFQYLQQRQAEESLAVVDKQIEATSSREVEPQQEVVASIDSSAIDQALEESNADFETSVPSSEDLEVSSKEDDSTQSPTEKAEVNKKEKEPASQATEPETDTASQQQAALESEKRKQIARQEEKRKEAAAKERRKELQQKAIVDAGYRQGLLHLNLQQAKEAAAEFERVIELDPSHVESYRNLGLAYVYDRRFEDAISAFEKYLGMADDNQVSNSKSIQSVEQLLVTLRERVETSARAR